MVGLIHTVLVVALQTVAAIVIGAFLGIAVFVRVACSSPPLYYSAPPPYYISRENKYKWYELY
jgi:hypothetical protein